MSRRVQMQKAEPLLDRLLALSGMLSRDEKIALMKAMAFSLNEPIYTGADVQAIVQRQLTGFQTKVLQSELQRERRR